jgi:hypothetical protein
MSGQPQTLDVSQTPELLRIAEEVRRTQQPRLLQRGRQKLALVVPLPPVRSRRRRVYTEADDQAFLQSAGGWADVDTERSRPPVEL